VFKINSLESLDMNYQSYSHLKIDRIYFAQQNHREFYNRFNQNAKSLCFKSSILPNVIQNSESLMKLNITNCKWINTRKIGNAWNMSQLKSLKASMIDKLNMKKVRIFFASFNKHLNHVFYTFSF